MKSDKRHVKMILESMFTTKEMVESNLTGEPSNAHRNEEGKPPKKLDPTRVAYALELFRNRMNIIGQTYSVSLERCSEMQFRNYVRDILHPYHRKRFKLRFAKK